MAAQVKREIEIMTRLHHPYIVDLHEVFPTQDKIYVVMELVPGGELFDHIIAHGPMKVRVAVQRLNPGLLPRFAAFAAAFICTCHSSAGRMC